jgi:hypothetical protein
MMRIGAVSGYLALTLTRAVALTLGLALALALSISASLDEIMHFLVFYFASP